MHKTLTLKITGVSPLLMHNGQLSDPLNPIVQTMKEITNKSSKNKTDEDYRLLGRLEFLGGLYARPKNGKVLDESFFALRDNDIVLTQDLEFYIPSDNIEAMIVNAAASQRKKKLAQAGIFVLKDAPLFDVPSLKSAFANPNAYQFTKRVKMKTGSAIQRTRPIFRQWSSEIEICYLKTVTEKMIREWVAYSGEMIGLGDWRPKYGRFEVS